MIESNLDSGPVLNRSSDAAVVFEEIVSVPGSTGLRLFFRAALLPDAPDPLVRGAFLRITSVEDGAVQTLDRVELERWLHSSAFFNGDAVRLELVVPAGQTARIAVHEILAEQAPDLGDRTICGPLDDRELSSDPRAARIVPVGCTAWLIDDAEGCFLTAGHCVGGTFSVVEFNVPLSDPDGAINHPPPDQQYAIDPASLQSSHTVLGDDWAYFGAFPNSETEATPIEVQGQSYVLGTPPTGVTGQTIRITGYGSVDGMNGNPQTYNQVQTTHTGALTSISGAVQRYTADTTGGNSGSAVYDEGAGEAIGIHTNGGCSAGGGSNSGTSLANSGLQNALAVPAGICANGPPPLLVALVDALPTPLPPELHTVTVQVTGRARGSAAADDVTLIYDAGAGDQSVPMTHMGADQWTADLPAQTCGSQLTARVEAVVGPATIHHPFSVNNSADRSYVRQVAFGFDTAFRDDFESDLGWTVVDDASLTAGSWQRGVPVGFGLRADPPWDADSSGQAFLTQNMVGNTDVDGGATTLLSPIVDLTGADDAHVSYWRWWSDEGSADLDDTFRVEISNDGGSTWTTLEEIGPNLAGSWQQMSFRVADVLPVTSQMRLQFIASDLGEGSIVEAAVDGVAFSNSASGLSCIEIFSDGFETGDVTSWTLSIP